MNIKSTILSIASIAMLFTACGPAAISADGSGTVKEGAKYNNGRKTGDLAKYIDDTEQYTKSYDEKAKFKYLDEADANAKSYSAEYMGDGKLFNITFSKKDVKNNEVVLSEYYWVYYKDDKPVAIKISRDEYPGEGKLIASKDWFFIKDGVVVECYRDKGEGKNVSGMQRIETQRYELDGDAAGYAKKITDATDAAKAKLAAKKFPEDELKDLIGETAPVDTSATK